MTDLEFWARWFSIVTIDLALAGDNALVIALAARTLPNRQQIHARIGGSLGAILLRLLLITIVGFLFKVPLLQLVGGLLLIWIALKLIRLETGVEGRVKQGATLLGAIWIIGFADVLMSLDNVLAVAAVAKGNFALVVFGISLSLPLVVWGSGVLAGLMNRYPWIIWIGGGILGYASGEMMLKDPVVRGALGSLVVEKLRIPLPLSLGMIITMYSWLLARVSIEGGERGTQRGS